ARAAREEAPSVAGRDPELAHALEDQVREEDAERHEGRRRGRVHPSAPRSSTYSAQKPGPRAESTACCPARISPSRRKRSSTNRQVGEDMLPWSRSTARACSRRSG